MPFSEELVPVLDDLGGILAVGTRHVTAESTHLMAGTYEIHVVFLKEARDDVRTKGEGHAAVVF
jgi:hypothetical protein